MKKLLTKLELCDKFICEECKWVSGQEDSVLHHWWCPDQEDGELLRGMAMVLKELRENFYEKN